MTEETSSDQVAQVLAASKEEILNGWVENQLHDRRIRTELFDPEELQRESRDYLNALATATASGNLSDITASEYEPVVRLLARISANRDRRGFTPSETASSMMSLKNSWHLALQTHYGDQPELLTRDVVTVSILVDSLALVTFFEWSKRREEIITRQTREILELSTPVVQVWEGVVIAPLIGTLDTQRAQQFTERLLDVIVNTELSVALVDITGVVAIDTRTAQHLIETISAVRLLGGQVIMTGVSPSVAQTLVHLGVELAGVVTRSSLAAGLRLALDMLNLQVIAKERKP